MTGPLDARALRDAEFPALVGHTYLNAASTGPLPARTQRVLDDWNRARTAPNSIPDTRLFETLRAARAAAAGLIGADPGEIGLSTNTSYGINVAARMLPLTDGDVVVASAGEFPANVFPWKVLGVQGVQLDLVPVTVDGWPDEDRLVARIEDPRVKVLAVSHVQFHTGYTADLDRLSAACRATGTWLVVDAIQALGAVPFDVRCTPVDVLSCGAQKWLLSPWGSGFLYVRKELIGELAPAYVGWLGFDGTTDFTRITGYQGELYDDGRRYELTTLPYQDLAGMTASIGLLTAVGVDAIRDHLRRVHAPVLEWARQGGGDGRGGGRLASPTGAHASGMICVVPPDLERAYQRLKAGKVTCSVREGAIRLAPHCYTTVEEMERVADLLG